MTGTESVLFGFVSGRWPEFNLGGFEMNKLISLIITVVLGITLVNCLHVNAGSVRSDGKELQIAIMDVMSSSISSSKRRTLTDVLRTEIFKLHLFKIVERGSVPRSAAMGLAF